ncbi:MAG: stage V sporulation protein AD [Oscillospiraceae bacterium]|nr:stage V sporulation protein AD [Oscillospiraceae bacterium]
MIRRIGYNTLGFEEMPSIIGYGSVVGQKEAQGPLKKYFDKIIYDSYAGQESWEKAESLFQQEAFGIALGKSKKSSEDINYIFAGDLLNQCVSSSFSMKEFNIPYLGQYGACSTMAQGLIMASVMVESGAANNAACVTSSHFCSAERQYRFPLEYGGQRTPTSQWTVTGSGSCILSNEKKGPSVARATVGTIVDYGITDVNNMGAAMAPAAAQTLLQYFSDTNTTPDDYDAIFTGDLGELGSQLLYEILKRENINIEHKHNDCGLMIYECKSQDVHCGGSGCGCGASVLCSLILNGMESRKYENIIFMATGALMSPTTCFQGENIPGIAHAVNIKLR